MFLNDNKETLCTDCCTMGWLQEGVWSSGI